MKKLRLAVFNTQPPTYLGGVERRILETAKRLQDKTETTVYSGSKGGLHEPKSVNGVKVIPCFSTDTAFPLDNWTFNQTLARNAAAFHADVYEAHTASGYGLLAAFRKRGVKVPFVQTVHGVLADEYAQARLRGGLSLRSRVANFFMWQLAQKELEAAQHATLVVTISRYSQQKIRQFYNINPAKIRIVPNGVDPERFKPEGDCAEIRRRIKLGDRQSVLFVGRLIPRKGLSYLVEAAKRVVKEHREIVFVIVGDGPLRNRLIWEVTQANLSGNFVFLGDVAEGDLPAVYRCVDVFAFPSVQEGQGIALLEAQASGKPVVAFDMSGVAEAVRNDKTGLLVKPNSEALAEAIMRLLLDASLRAKMGAQGREFVKKELSWDVCAEKMFSVYREARKSVA
ncbi:MAG: glycosyltransferase family 4 protein [Candidatus Bathyarchaeota archaeon]|nr:glycosyltransferase family 4 protein [Candidatus Bathyarchaeota archaeon]